MSDIQRDIAESVARRGYRDGWTAAQFLARQVCKAVEELSELSEQIGNAYVGPEGARLRLYWAWQQVLHRAALSARLHFDDSSRPAWDNAHIIDLDALRSEVADMQVVLCNIAAAIEEITSEPFDLLQAAASKARADEGRGRRGNSLEIGG